MDTVSLSEFGFAMKTATKLAGEKRFTLRLTAGELIALHALMREKCYRAERFKNPNDLRQIVVNLGIKQIVRKIEALIEQTAQ